MAPSPLQMSAAALAMRNRSVVGTLIGGIRDTQGAQHTAACLLLPSFFLPWRHR